MAEQQLRLAKRSQIYTSLMFIELNEFEQINQTWGNELSQDAIVAIAKLLKRCFRSSDTLGRIGEYQFAVLIQGQDLSCEVIQNRVKTNRPLAELI